MYTTIALNAVGARSSCSDGAIALAVARSDEAWIAEETMIEVCLDLERCACGIELSIDVPFRERVPCFSPRVDTVGHVDLLIGGKGCTERGWIVVIVDSAGHL